LHSCDRLTGQCVCLPNVVGTRCDRCAENHWKIASGEGCEACKCDEIGAYNDQCNPVRHCIAFFKGKNLIRVIFSMMDNVNADQVLVEELVINAKLTFGAILMLSAKV
jgi:Laminin EGF domain